MKCLPRAFAVLLGLCCLRAAPAAIIFGGTSQVLNEPAALGSAPYVFVPSGFGATGSVLFTGDMTLPNAIAIQAGAIANFQSFFQDVLSGPVSGAGALSKQLPGTLTLSGTNSYSGGTTVSGGTLAVSNASALGSGDLHLVGAGLLGTADVALPNAFVLSGASNLAAASGTTLATGFDINIDPAASVTIGRPGADGTVLWRGNANFSDARVDVVAGGLRIGHAVHRGHLPTLSVQSGAQFDLAGHDIETALGGGSGHIGSSVAGGVLRIRGGTFEGILEGALELEAAAGVTTLAGQNLHNGGTLIAAGAELAIVGDGTLGGAIRNDGVLTIRKPDTLTLDGPISGSGVLQKQARGRLTLSGANTYGGGTRLELGTLAITRGDALGSGAVTINNATLLGLADATVANEIRIDGEATVAAAHGTRLEGTGLMLDSGRSILHFGAAGADGHVSWDLERFTGDLLVDAGSVQANAKLFGGRLSEYSINVAAGAVLELAMKEAGTSRLTGAGDIISSTPGLLFSVQSANFAGRLLGNMGLDFFSSLGGSTTGVVLSGQNDYSGGTNVYSSAALTLAGGAGLTGDLRVEGLVMQQAGSKLRLRDLILEAVQGTNITASFVQSGGDTEVVGNFNVGAKGLAIYDLDGGSLSLNAARVVEGAFNRGLRWTAGTLRFLDDYTLSEGAPLLFHSQRLESDKLLRARNLGLADDASLTLEGGSLVADIELHNAGLIEGAGQLEAPALLNTGRIEFASGASGVRGDLSNAPGGSIALAKAAQVTFDGDLVNDGLLAVAEGATARFKGRVSGAGDFSGTGKSIYEGEFHPGHSPARLVMEGGQVFENTAVIDLDLGGATAPGDCAQCYAQIVFEGPVEFHSASLAVHMFDGYLPRGGELFTIFVFNAAHSGSFDDIRLPDLGKALQWDTSALMSRGQLRIAAVPVPGASWLLLSALAVLSADRRRRA